MFTRPYIHVSVPLQLSIPLIPKVSNGNYTTNTFIPRKYITLITSEYSSFQKVWAMDQLSLRTLLGDVLVTTQENLKHYN
jgi:hypothetical protein